MRIGCLDDFLDRVRHVRRWKRPEISDHLHLLAEQKKISKEDAALKSVKSGFASSYLMRKLSVPSLHGLLLLLLLLFLQS